MIKIILSNPKNPSSTIDYEIDAYDNPLAHDWQLALKDVVLRKLRLDKEFCFLGFPYSHRNISVLCDELNGHIRTINKFNSTQTWRNAGLKPYVIEEWFDEASVRFDDSYAIAPNDGDDSLDNDPRYLGLKIKHDIMNRLHRHFERLQGTVGACSAYYMLADDPVKLAIRSLNLICHELESLILSQRKVKQNPIWVRPSQIMSFHDAPRHLLTDDHKSLFDGSYDRRFGEVYMHWCQIGKTLMEVFRDEGAIKLNVGSDPGDISVGSGATCEAINSLKYYSGEFDIEWGGNITRKKHSWHRREIDEFNQWLTKNQIPINPQQLSLGHLPIARIDTVKWFGTKTPIKVWAELKRFLNVKSIEIDGVSHTYEYQDRHV